MPASAGLRSGVWFAAVLLLGPADGSEVTWTCEALNRLDESGWMVEREVVLAESPIGEPVILASNELPVLQFTQSVELARALPQLVEELLGLPTPAA